MFMALCICFNVFIFCKNKIVGIFFLLYFILLTPNLFDDD